MKIVVFVPLFLGLLAFLLLSAGAFLFWASRGMPPLSPDYLEIRATPAEIVKLREPLPPPPLGQDITLKVMSFNIAYGRGPVDDAGNLRDKAAIIAYLDKIVAAIKTVNPDIIALQEVDFHSKRTHFIDEMAYIGAGIDFPYAARAVTWKKNYVPHPPLKISQHYGRMESGQVIFSRYPILTQSLFYLPKPASQPFYYKAFYLHRLAQMVDIRVGANDVRLFNIHLEAFDRENRQIQAASLVDQICVYKKDYTLLAGDFNTIPTDASLKKGFADEPQTDFSEDSSLSYFQRCLGLTEILAPGPGNPPPPERSSFTFPADKPNRRLDYLFYSAAFSRKNGEVLQNAGAISDHLPIVGELRLPNIPANVEPKVTFDCK
jgi:endonuclease/exonuclease/phosphatase family metal-dependent hydrolase